MKRDYLGTPISPELPFILPPIKGKELEFVHKQQDNINNRLTSKM